MIYEQDPFVAIQEGFSSFLSEDYKTSENVFRRTLENVESVKTTGIEYVACLTGLAQALIFQTRLLEAKEYLDEAIKIYQDYFPEHLFELSTAFSQLASIHLELKDYALAAVNYSRALVLAESVLGTKHRGLETMLCGYEECLSGLGRGYEADLVHKRIEALLTSDIF